MRSVLGPSVWSAAQYMVILYFMRELFKFCWEACVGLALCCSMKCIFSVKHFTVECLAMMGAFEQKGLAVSGTEKRLYWVDFQVRRWMICCGVVSLMICWRIHFYMHGFAVLLFMNICRLLWIRTWRRQWIKKRVAQVISLFFSYNCDVTLSWCMAFLTITDIFSLVDKIIFCYSMLCLLGMI